MGLQGLTSFVTPAEFFRPFLNRSALFNHTWQVVGRSDHIQQVHDFIESQQHKVAVLVGRGGIGKSKILHALADTFHTGHQRKSLWFAAEGVPLTQDGADHLPYESCILVVDDAHRRSDLPALLALSRQRPHVTKLILSCRPQGIDFLKSQLTQGGFDVSEVAVLPNVEQLSREEVTELGRQALGPEFAYLAEQLALATWDCPLVTVVGGQLLAQKDIAPELLERDGDFRDAVLTRFRDILVGEVGDRIDAVLCRSLLDLVAAIQPIRLDNEIALDLEAEFLNIDQPGLLRTLGLLEEAGVLLRRGSTLRIVPDVLADHILHQVSVTPHGQKTGYVDVVYQKFASLCPSEVLRNLSELDWRLRRSGAQDSDLLGGVWQSIKQEFQNASNSGRCTILGLLEDVAVYQPGRILELVEYAVRDPATKAEDPKLSKVYEYTHGHVLRQLPTLLRRISYTLDFLPRCCSLLWELGKDDDRDLNPNPDHAMRVLADLASYDIGKPLAVHHLVLDTMEKLLETPGMLGRVYSLLDMLDPMLAKTGHSTRSEGYKLVFRPFVLKRGGIEPIRQRSIALVVDCLSSHSLGVKLRALKSLENALREPFGDFSMEVSDEDREQWRPEQLEILKHLADLAQSSTEPLVLLRIRDVLRWHRSYSASIDIRGRAEAIVASIPESFELRLTQELMDPFHSKDKLPEEREGDDGYKRHRERIEQKQRAVIAEFLSRFGNSTTAYKILTGRIQTMTDAGVEIFPQVILGILGRSDPEAAAGLCDMIVDDPEGALAPHLQPLLSNVRIWNAQRAHSICQRALGGGSNIICRGVALSYQSRGWADSATAQDIENIRELLNHEDMVTKSLAIGALGFLAEAREIVATDLAKNVELGDSKFLTAELCQLFFRGLGLSFGQLTSDDLRSLLFKFEDVQDIDDLYINTFLARASERDAGAVLELLLRRIRKADDVRITYSALPSLGFDHPLIGLAKSPDQEHFLRQIRDASLEKGWSVAHWIPELFKEVSLRFESSGSLNVLDEWINSGESLKIKLAAHIVSRAQPDFVFSHLGFISNLLERASGASHDCYQSVCSSLLRSALTGTGMGTAGQPLPKDVNMREQASAVATQFHPGDPTNRFFASLAESADASIRIQMLRDEELFE